MNAAEISNALKGRRSGSGYIVRCVAHEDRSPSLSLADGSGGRLLVRCHAGCDSLAILAELKRLNLLEDQVDRRHHQVKPAPRPVAGANGVRGGATVDAILDRCRSIAHTPVATYLECRGVAVPSSGDLRYLPSGAKYPWPTMVGIITDFATGERLSLHFTAIALDGRGKAPVEKPRRLLAGHRKAKGVIRLTDDAHVTTELGIAEGVETALAIARALGPWRPVWSAIDAGNLAGLPVVPGIERLIVYADTDSSGAGQAAAAALAARWHRAGREAYIAQPPAPVGGKADWNDVVAA